MLLPGIGRYKINARLMNPPRDSSHTRTLWG
jgi:hypothetical protein